MEPRPLKPQRPAYIGVGACTCGRYEVPLFITRTEAPTCRTCCEAAGYEFSVDRVRLEPPLPEPQVHVGKLELGHGHTFEAVIGTDDCLVGWLHTHPDARVEDDSALCQSFCAVRPINATPVHQVLCADPLTLTPSLKCRMCGAHGEVLNGKWEPR